MVVDLVSIIVPVYNAEKTIVKTFQSVLSQSYNNFELIIIDDCSRDNSFSIMNDLSKKDDRIQIYRNDINIGVARTRNFGINKSKGKFICFLDSDDIWDASKLEKQLQYINEKNADICYTSYNIIDNEKNIESTFKVQSHVNYKSLLKENIICCSTTMVRSDILKRHLFKTEFFHEDFVLWLELLKCGYKAVGMKECLVTYRKGGRSADKIKAFKNRWIIYRKCENLSLISAIYYFIFYSINGIKKYYLN